MSRSSISESGQIAGQTAPGVSDASHTPWVIPLGDDNGCVICEGDDPANPGRILFVLRNPSGTSRLLSFEELSANAAFIVRACNSHKALVKALEFIRDGYDNQDVNHVDFRVKAYQVALDALASAREAQP